MRKFLSLLTMCLLTTAAWATTVENTIVAIAQANNWTQSAGNDVTCYTSFTLDNVITVSTTGEPNCGSFWGSDWRLYQNKSGNIIITAANGNNLQSVKLTFNVSNSGCLNYGSTRVSSGSEVSVSGNSVEFTVGNTGAATNGQVRLTAISVTYGSGETVAKPIITPVAGTYYDPINVAISCATDGASIYYTTNGSTPTASSTLYSAPFELSANATVKAIAIKGSLQSDVAEAAYEFGTATEVANIAAFDALEQGTMAKFTNPVTVLAQYTTNNGNSRLFVKDATGYMYIYGQVGQTYTNGMQIPAGFVGEKSVYDGMIQFAVKENTFQAGVAGTAVEPETIQAVDVESDYVNHFVYIANATLGYTTNSSGSKYLATISDNSGQAAAYNNMGITSIDYDATYNVTAIVGSHIGKDTEGQDSTIYQVWPVKLEKVGGTTPTDGVATIAEYLALADNATFTFTGNAVVTYVNDNDKRYLYIKDNTGAAMIYGTGIANDFAQGDVLASGWTGKKTNYNGLHEITNAANLSKSGQTQTVTPAEVSTTDVTTSNENVYCVLRGVKIASVNGKNFTFEDGTAGYNQFNDVILPSDLTQAYDIEGVISVHNAAQFVPTRFLTEVSVPKVADIAELLEKESGVTYEIQGDITAIYQKGSRLFVKDADTYMLVYGYMAGEEHQFTNGDIIRGAQASWTTYEGAPQLTPVVSTFVVAEHGTPVQPETMAIEELGTDMIHMYVKMNNVDLVKDTEEGREKYATITDETGDITLFNQFGLEMPADGNYNAVIGFVSVYQGAIQVYPVEFIAEETPVLPVGDVTGDMMVDVEDVNAVINIILKVKTQADYPGNADLDGSGMVDVEDMNMIINIILSNH